MKKLYSTGKSFTELAGRICQSVNRATIPGWIALGLNPHADRYPTLSAEAP
jgi:hypothetical protein